MIELKKRSLPMVKLYMPSTFMNSCGPDIQEKARRSGVEPGQMLVVCDDFTIPLKRMKFGYCRDRPVGTTD